MGDSFDGRVDEFKGRMKRLQWYELFRLTLEQAPDELPATQEALGARFGLNRDGVKYRLGEVKESFLVLFRAKVQNEVGDDANIDEEIGDLLRLPSK